MALPEILKRTSLVLEKKKGVVGTLFRKLNRNEKYVFDKYLANDKHYLESQERVLSADNFSKYFFFFSI